MLWSHHKNFLDEKAAHVTFNDFRLSLQWQNQEIKIFGKTMLQPRLICFYADPGVLYSYSGSQQEALDWTPGLLEIKEMVEEMSRERFNCVLCNLYRDGSDSMGWHSDDEKELGEKPFVASLSLGQKRRMRVRSRDKSESFGVDLESGDLFLMRRGFQEAYQHSIPKSARPLGERINLTFRYVLRADHKSST